MNIHEYQAKGILREFGVPVLNGFVVKSTEEVSSHIIDRLKSKVFVIKAQIHAGGRGKAGGIKLAKSFREAKELVKDMLGMTLITHQTGPKGKQVRKVYIEEGSSIKKEYYLSMIIDSKYGKPLFIFSIEGGVDIEEVVKSSPEKIIKFNDITNNYNKLICNFNLNLEQVKKIANIIDNLQNAFIALDASQIEINPLVETFSGDFVALDAKINFDDNALYRHPEILNLRDYDEEVREELEASKYGLSYIKMDGKIGCMVNGAGLAMATMDMIKYYGAEPANFLDIGGGASKEAIAKAFSLILSDSDVKGILVNIFGGIMRCDIVANGITEALKRMDMRVPLVVRLLGTNFNEGKRILEESELSIITADKLDEAALKIIRAVA